MTTQPLMIALQKLKITTCPRCKGSREGLSCCRCTLDDSVKRCSNYGVGDLHMAMLPCFDCKNDKDESIGLLNWRLSEECGCHGVSSYGSTHQDAHEVEGSCTCCRDKCLGSGRFLVPEVELPGAIEDILLQMRYIISMERIDDSWISLWLRNPTYSEAFCGNNKMDAFIKALFAAQRIG